MSLVRSRQVTAPTSPAQDMSASPVSAPRVGGVRLSAPPTVRCFSASLGAGGPKGVWTESGGTERAGRDTVRPPCLRARPPSVTRLRPVARATQPDPAGPRDVLRVAHPKPSHDPERLRVAGGQRWRVRAKLGRMRDTVLVTGAAGFIGHHVVRLLRAEGRPVRALILPGEDTRNLDPLRDAGLELVEGDIRDRDALAARMAGCDVVYHLAAIYRTWVPDPRVIYDVNVTGTANVLAVAAAQGVRRVVDTSSIAAIGLDPGGAPADETAAYNLWPFAFDYVRSKYLAHHVALAFTPIVDLVVVNPGMPLGPGDVAPTPTGKTLIDTLNGKIRVSFEGGLNLVDVEDVARGHLLAEARGRRGEAYLLTGHNMTISAMVGELRRVVGMRHGMLKIPAGLAAAFGRVLEGWADRVSRREPLITPGTVAYASQRLFYDNRKAREELGFTVRPLDETLHRAVAWFVAHGHVRPEAVPASLRDAAG